MRIGRRGAGRKQPRRIIALRFLGRKLGAELKLFELLAPFVVSGSRIALVGEDGQSWNLFFEEERLRILDGDDRLVNSINPWAD